MAKQPKIILGVSYGHGDSSAALIVGDQLVAAAEEERFNRIKHFAHFPTQAVKYCLEHANIAPEQVEVVAIAKRPWNLFHKKIALVLAHPKLIRKPKSPMADRKASLSKELKQLGLNRAKVQRVEHHLAHLYSCRYLDQSSEPAYLSFDGLGDFVSASIGKTIGHEIKILDRMIFPHSVGFFYSALTQYLGFPHYGDEFKVMGLSSFGQPKYLKEMRNLIRKKENFGCELNLEAFPLFKKPMKFFIEKSQPKLLPFYNLNYMTQLIGFSPRKPNDPILQCHKDLAKSAQVCFEEIGNHLLLQLYGRVPSSTVALSGGCAHNSVWVGQITKNTPFKKVLVAPASHDAGIAVGAAICFAGRPITPQGGHWGLLGPQPKKETENLALSSFQWADTTEELTFATEDKLTHWVVKELINGKIIGLFDGRMEFGPRALGSRSILADPRNPEMKDKLNSRVKHRESFRPFAASVVEEFQHEWFDDAFFCPTMEAVFQVKKDKKNLIPAVVHTDNSCRIQSVTRKTQPFYWNLIENFRKKTGVPMLINTSFNDCEPIVCSTEDAIKCFLNTDMDYLILDRKVLFKKKDAMKMVG
ncbi:MAG: carbamoyltransferase [Deltaproteobacteria bacterium]|nr:carbamoyltransferase [Deltaproteobacteria bacterium]